MVFELLNQYEFYYDIAYLFFFQKDNRLRTEFQRL